MVFLDAEVASHSTIRPQVIGDQSIGYEGRSVKELERPEPSAQAVSA